MTSQEPLNRRPRNHKPCDSGAPGHERCTWTRAMNAIALLKADHRAVEELFHQLEVKSRGKKPLIEKLVRELSIHSAIEEEIFYPAVRKSVPGAQGQVLESLEEHNVVKWELSALASMNEGDERF